MSLTALFNTYFAPIDIGLGLITVFASCASWLYLRMEARRRRRQWVTDAISAPGLRPAAIVINVSKRDIDADVRQAIGAELRSSAIPEERIVTLNWRKELTVQDYPALIDQFREVLAKVARMGADKKFVFFAGPVSASMALGAELAHAGAVHVMHYDQSEGRYRNWGPLRRPVG